MKGASVYQVRSVALPLGEAATEQHGKDGIRLKTVIKDKNGEVEDGKAAVSLDTSRKDDTEAKVMCPTASPIRIVVRYLSYKIPGPRSKRKVTLANTVCR